MFGNAPARRGVVSSRSRACLPDLATLLEIEGVAVRSGHHCAHLLAWLGVSATCRASLAFYNTHAEVERFVAALRKVRRLLA